MLQNIGCSRRNLRPRRTAFTLVELVVVIAVIAILAALLLPALVRAKEEGRAAVCLSNVKQFGYAWLMYAQDHNEAVPPNQGGARGFVEGPSWVYGYLEPMTPDWSDNTNTLFLQQSLLAPYLGNSLGVWRCPSDKSVAQEGGRWFPRTRTYTMNGLFSYPYLVLTNLTQIIRPVETFVLLDEREDSIQSCLFGVDAVNGPAALAGVPGSYHNGCASILFAEGHAERHKWLDPRTNPPLIPDTPVNVRFTSWPPNPDVAWLRAHGRFVGSR